MANDVTLQEYQTIQLQLAHVLGNPNLFNAFTAVKTAPAGSDQTPFFKSQGIDLGPNVKITKTDIKDEFSVCLFAGGNVHCITIRSPVVLT